MAKDKIMPGIGCLNRRLYIEQKQAGTIQNTGVQDPCIMCQKRSICIKPTVSF